MAILLIMKLNEKKGKNMKEFRYVIKDPVGIHARPAGLLAKAAKEFSSKIIIEANGKSADVTRLMSVMGLGAKTGTEILVRIEGEDEEAAFTNMQKFMEHNL